MGSRLVDPRALFVPVPDSTIWRPLEEWEEASDARSVTDPDACDLDGLSEPLAARSSPRPLERALVRASASERTFVTNSRRSQASPTTSRLAASELGPCLRIFVTASMTVSARARSPAGVTLSAPLWD